MLQSAFGIGDMIAHIPDAADKHTKLSDFSISHYTLGAYMLRSKSEDAYH